VHPLWFYKHQHDNRIRSKLSVACQWWWFQWRFAAILVNCAPSGEMPNYCTPHIIKENLENFLIHRCNYILLSQVYFLWQYVTTPTIIFNNPVFIYSRTPFIRKLVIRIANNPDRLGPSSKDYNTVIVLIFLWLNFFSLEFIYRKTPFIRKLVIRIANNPDRLGPSNKDYTTVIVLIFLWLNFFSFEFIYGRTPFIRKLVIRIANNPDRLGPQNKSFLQ